MVLPSMIEEAEEPEVVDSFIRILQKVILEDCLVHIDIYCESAFEQRSSLGCFHRSDLSPSRTRVLVLTVNRVKRSASLFIIVPGVE